MAITTTNTEARARERRAPSTSYRMNDAAPVYALVILLGIVAGGLGLIAALGWGIVAAFRAML